VRTDDFDYHLPDDRIAQRPTARGASRMLVLDRSDGAVDHRRVADLPDYLAAGDVVLLNDTRVIPARLEARRPTGRRFEVLLLRELDDRTWECLLRPSSRARVAERLMLDDDSEVEVVASRGGGRWLVRFDPVLELDRLDRLGQTPLPPYIVRQNGATAQDRTDYQTVYASVPGAVAAPTAGLHFTRELLDRVRRSGAEVAFVTLHVGLGTFRPVTADRIEDHRMHSEWYRFSPDAARAVNDAVADGRRVVCIGTTSVRALEGALQAGSGRVRPGDDWTELFITPGFEFRGVGAMLTNFHLPRSTLLMLVSALAGRERVLAAYREAVETDYRFFSYGDAMLVL
jgi:S-adenosylmethionine:tRNA ribosyltransferase-isomerase